MPVSKRQKTKLSRETENGGNQRRRNGIPTPELRPHLPDNERLTKMYTESLTKLANQLERRAKCRNLEEELKKVNDEHLHKEDEYKKAMEMLKHNHAFKTAELEEKIRCCLLQKQANEVTINQLRQDSSACKSQIDILTNSLEKVNVDVELKYHHEIQDLKDCLLVEQEEKRELIKKLQIAEKELMICKMKQADQQRESTSNRHVETLKQKIMKLRKENEVLKRQLLVPQFEDM
ncbi:protein At-4/1 isoform X2 [Magnolia sinica]|uniref:protein At-4/1 isoform X2 n=1 Tax=Magnolia sinica TaxID=86752 RepID=UPI00265AE9FD|nr:protein At-4/1 isoform X2 [Magnolia sinica]